MRRVAPGPLFSIGIVWAGNAPKARPLCAQHMDFLERAAARFRAGITAKRVVTGWRWVMSPVSPVFGAVLVVAEV